MPTGCRSLPLPSPYDLTVTLGNIIRRVDSVITRLEEAGVSPSVRAYDKARGKRDPSARTLLRRLGTWERVIELSESEAETWDEVTGVWLGSLRSYEEARPTHLPSASSLSQMFGGEAGVRRAVGKRGGQKQSQAQAQAPAAER